jgi:hypothetical protein
MASTIGSRAPCFHLFEINFLATCRTIESITTTHTFVGIPHPRELVNAYCGELLAVAIPRDVVHCLRAGHAVVARFERGEGRRLHEYEEAQAAEMSYKRSLSGNRPSYMDTPDGEGGMEGRRGRPLWDRDFIFFLRGWYYLRHGGS